MSLRKVRGNIERLFDKNLTDLVRGIRNNRENEVSPCRNAGRDPDLLAVARRPGTLPSASRRSRRSCGRRT